MKTMAMAAWVSALAAVFAAGSYGLAAEGVGKAKVLTQQEIDERNASCVFCHEAIMNAKTRDKEIIILHKRHYESEKTEYNQEQKLCVTCHGEVAHTNKKGEIREGFFNEGDDLHPVYMKPAYRKLIRRAPKKGMTSADLYLEGIQPRNPYLFKPVLHDLACVACHGPDSKIKTLYGTPEKEK